jgi:hypothetical protein
MELIYAYQQHPQKDLLVFEHHEPPVLAYLATEKNYARYNMPNNHRGSINMSI